MDRYRYVVFIVVVVIAMNAGCALNKATSPQGKPPVVVHNPEPYEPPAEKEGVETHLSFFMVGGSKAEARLPDGSIIIVKGLSGSTPEAASRWRTPWGKLSVQAKSLEKPQADLDTGIVLQGGPAGTQVIYRLLVRGQWQVTAALLGSNATEGKAILQSLEIRRDK